jgi:hypothetical protein
VAGGGGPFGLDGYPCRESCWVRTVRRGGWAWRVGAAELAGPPKPTVGAWGVAALLMWPLRTGLLDTVGRVGTDFGPNRPFCFVGWVGSKDLVIEVT